MNAALETITIDIRGVNGSGRATFAAAAWSELAPVSKILALHDALRDVTAGRPFAIVNTKSEQQP